MTRLGRILVGALLVIGILGPAAAYAAVDDRFAPSGVIVTSPDLTATVSWTPGTTDGLTGYRVEVRDMHADEQSALTTVGADVTSVVIKGLPRWYSQIARVTAVFDDGDEISSEWSAEFQVVSTLVLDHDEPIVQHGDGVCCETYVIDRGFHLDAPMPIDVWISPKTVAYDGSDAHDGYDQTDPSWPANVDSFPIEIPAGTTRGTYPIVYLGDDWKRFEYVHDTFGFESWTYPQYSEGFVHLDGARQEFTLFEDDPYFWPDVIVDPDTAVTAGRTAKVRVRLDRTAHHPTVLRYVVRDGSARGGRDFVARGHQVTVAKGHRVAFVRVPTKRLGPGAASRTFTVRVTQVREQMARLTAHSTSTVRISR
ncbi:fibronectin type III domain-containing protein [Nocardioides sp.]|uniref:fibronectin type III domain-containing protein n=1 Tax=Nocardioides sp. TaxID=35761 RepID=UPI0037838C1A